MMHHYPDLISASDWLKQISHAVQPRLGPYEMKAFFSQARFFFVNILFFFYAVYLWCKLIALWFEIFN